MRFHTIKQNRFKNRRIHTMNKQYEMALNVFEKQNNGQKLEKREKNWKKRYNEARTDSIRTEKGVKITRYMPNWCESDNW